MKLIYRGHSYEVPDPAQLDSTDQPTTKLIYRGHLYNYTSPTGTFEVIPTDTSTVTLIYRGVTYEHKLFSSKLSQKHSVCNWRYQIPEEG
jgi:hypothetical protein